MGLDFTLGDRLRKAREHAGMTQLQMAAYLGISKNTVTRYERDGSRPARAIVLVWAARTNVSDRWLLKGEEAA